jgi:hypothetical protein
VRITIYVIFAQFMSDGCWWIIQRIFCSVNKRNLTSGRTFPEKRLDTLFQSADEVFTPDLELCVNLALHHGIVMRIAGSYVSRNITS